MWTLLYDGECALCRMLAGLLSGPVMAWQDLGERILRSAQDDGERILRSAQDDGERILRSAQDDGRTDIGVADLSRNPPLIITGTQAWEILIEQEPGLQKWQWLAGKLGMSPGTAATALRSGAHLARRICSRCGPRSPLTAHSITRNPLTRLPEQPTHKNQEKEET